MTQPSAGQPVHRPAIRGNPVKRRRGEAIRAVLVATIKPGKPMALEAACDLVAVSRTHLIDQLNILRTAGRIRGYTTQNGMVRVW